MVAGALQQRILTALILVPVVVAAVALLPTPSLALSLALVVALGAWEWTALAGIASRGGRIAYLALVAGCLLLLWQAPRPWLPVLLIPAAIWWWGLALYLFRVRAIEVSHGVDTKLIPVGLLVLVGPWAAIVHLHGLAPPVGPRLVLFLLVLTWVADSAAYFAGRRWGCAKLAPVLSPGKTRVGVYAALLGAAACGALLAWGLGLDLPRAGLAVTMCALTAFVSVIGDLFESLLKRRRGLKDSGRLLPGHGGVLDRIDSLTAAAPVFALGVAWLGTVG